tara:strand:- start:864 stop:1310 length:447 start_codon:yes stop_codon:yes gene_type:complete
MGLKANQTVSTRNQSTVQYYRENIFLFGNRYQKGVINNASGADITVKRGQLVLRDTDNANGIKLAVAGATLVGVIGVLAIEDEIVIPNGGSVEVNYCIKGDIDSTLLQLPETVTLDTVPTGGNKNVRDLLTDLGFVLFKVNEQSKFEN